MAGTVEADGARDAGHKIKVLGFLPTEIEEQSFARKHGLLGQMQKAGIPAVTRQLAILLRSGVPLVDALKALSDENRGYLRSVLVGLNERVKGGASLSRAMEEFDGVFPIFYTSMVAAGQESGNLDRVLEGLADFMESQDAIKDKVRAAMVYPLIMASVGAVVMAFLFTFVVPKIVAIFDNTGAALPIPTLILIFLSNLFVHYWWLLGGAVLAMAYLARRLRARHSLTLGRMLLNLPFSSLYYARFTRTLGFLLEGGLPMLRALDISGRATGNPWLQENIHDAAVRVSEGARLSTSIKGIPPVLQQLLSTGERSGRLAEILGNAAESYEANFDRQVQRAIALVEPGMILVMGLIVGFIVMAVLLPMFQLNQLIR